MKHEELVEILTGYCEKKGISEIIKVDQRPAVASGENHLSVVTIVDVTAKQISGEQATLSMICKTFPKGRSCVKFLEDTSAFRKEIVVYSEVIPKMSMIGPQTSQPWPDVCGYRPYDVLLLTNLKADGFSSLQRKEFLDLEHSLFALRNLAKFHGWSKVLIKEGLVEGMDFLSYHLTANPLAVHNSIGKGVKSLGKAMQQDWTEEWYDCGRVVESYAESMADRLAAQKLSDDKKLQVLNHGDYWTSNLMFKHVHDTRSQKESIIDIKMLDFQMVHLNSLGWDVNYFLHTSVRPIVRRGNYTALLLEYHRTLQKTMEELDFGESEIPTLEEILRDLERLVDLEIVATCFFRVIFTSKHLYDVEAALSNNNEQGLDGLDPKTLSDPDYIGHSGEDIKNLMSKV